jgi:hypothetical protein
MTLFMVIEKHTWIKGLAVLLLLGIAFAVYLIWPGDKNLNNLSELQTDSSPVVSASKDQPIIDNISDVTDQPGESMAMVTVEPVSIGFFDEYRLMREKNRAAQTENLKELLAKEPNLTDSLVQQELIRVLQWTEKETQAEGLLHSIGYDQVIVVISDSGANIVVSEVINRDEAKSIGDIVSQVTGVALAKITITDGVSLQ